jgi:hypothetical protein
LSRLFLALGLLTGTLCGPTDASAVQALAAAKPVSLTVDYGDGVQKRFTVIPWKPGMTVLDVLETARKHPRGIRFKYRGSGSRAFLFQIDDIENEGKGDNWIFRVNGTLGDRSFAIFKLNAGDAVLWEFGKSK